MDGEERAEGVLSRGLICPLPPALPHGQVGHPLWWASLLVLGSAVLAAARVGTDEGQARESPQWPAQHPTHL